LPFRFWRTSAFGLHTTKQILETRACR